MRSCGFLVAHNMFGKYQLNWTLVCFNLEVMCDL